jgi:hypothetical protein
MGIQDTDVGIVAFAFETVTVTNSAIGLTSGTYTNAIKAEMTLERFPIRVRTDGTDPTATEGHVIDEGSMITLEGTAEIAAFRAYRADVTDAILKVTYYH